VPPDPEPAPAAPQPVEVVQFSGEALEWVKLLFISNLLLMTAVLLVLVAFTVVHLWRGS
jgi:hypothetical protein